MSEPLADRLRQFTPQGAALDRDALLFHAGRASVRRGQGWMISTLALAVCQVVTLTLLWPRSAPQNGPITIEPSPPAAAQPEPTPAVDPSEWLALTRRAAASGETDLSPSTPAGPLVPDGPVLGVSTQWGKVMMD
jgi:hypothetical protein